MNIPVQELNSSSDPVRISLLKTMMILNKLKKMMSLCLMAQH